MEGPPFAESRNAPNLTHRVPQLNLTQLRSSDTEWKKLRQILAENRKSLGQFVENGSAPIFEYPTVHFNQNTTKNMWAVIAQPIMTKNTSKNYLVNVIQQRLLYKKKQNTLSKRLKRQLPSCRALLPLKTELARLKSQKDLTQSQLSTEDSTPKVIARKNQLPKRLSVSTHFLQKLDSLKLDISPVIEKENSVSELSDTNYQESGFSPLNRRILYGPLTTASSPERSRRQSTKTKNSKSSNKILKVEKCQTQKLVISHAAWSVFNSARTSHAELSVNSPVVRTTVM